MKKERVFELIKENLSEEILQSQEIKTTTEFISDLGFESITFMGMFLELEEELGLSIISSDKNYLFFSIITVQDLLDAIEEVM